ncbi:MAG: tetratricopeptide repeat protein [Treponema sp.]|nr:tetratricopeptide repeat protein [Treponema sp.]
MRHRFYVSVLFLFSIFTFSCAKNTASEKKFSKTLGELSAQLENPAITQQVRYSVINRIANLYYAQGKTDEMVLFLTEWVELHPSDTYNSYWLFMVASNYLKEGEEPLAEYYYERIINNFPDLLVNGESIHFSCLEHLIQISKSSQNRINYFNRIISNFPQNVSITEMYSRLALEYENVGEWDLALKSYTLFLEQNDASTIQIPGLPNAYTRARQTVDFSKSTKDWTFASLEELESSVKKAISSYNWRALDKYRSKVNFFAMSWKSSESDANALESFSMHDYMRGNRIRYLDEMDESSTPTEAYLRTWGWTSYINVWYLYFRKVDFPADPEIHGRWEWAGIYFGEKL